MRTRTSDGRLQARFLDGLQQVIDRVQLEGLDGVIVEGGDERHERQVPPGETPHDVQTPQGARRFRAWPTCRSRSPC
jgi:hypothetical protein